MDDLSDFKQAFQSSSSSSSSTATLDFQWETTHDVIFVGEDWKPGVHCMISKVTLDGKRIALHDVPFLVSIQPGYVFKRTDVGTVEVVLEVPPGIINGVAHGGFRQVKTVTVKPFSKELKGKNASDAHQKMVVDQNAMLCFTMEASLSGGEATELPLSVFAKHFLGAVWRIMGDAKKATSDDHIYSDALFDMDLEESEDAERLMELRERIRNLCDQIIELGYPLTEFLECKDLDAREETPDGKQESGCIYSRKQLLKCFGQLEALNDEMLEALQKLEPFYLKAKKASSVSSHSVGSLFKENASFAKTVKFKHQTSFFELGSKKDEILAGLKSLDALDHLVGKMAVCANRLMGKVGDGLEVDEQGLKAVKLLEEVRTEILLLITQSACPALKAALLDPTGPFCLMFNKLSAQSCADKREDLWGKFAGWWKQMSEGTRKRFSK